MDYCDDLDECRICFDVEKRNNEFISPCRCSGTSKYVHIKCITRWRNMNKQGEAYNHCMECKERYIVTRNFEREMVNIRFYKNKKSTNSIYCMSIPTAFLMCLLDSTTLHFIDFLNGSSKEPIEEICIYDGNKDSHIKCFNTTTLKQEFRSEDGIYTRTFFYLYFVMNAFTFILSCFFMRDIIKQLKRKRIFIIDSCCQNICWYLLFFKFILLYKITIGGFYSPGSFMGICIAGIFIEPVLFKFFVNTNERVIQDMNTDNPEKLRSWSEELAIDNIAFDFRNINEIEIEVEVDTEVELEEVNLNELEGSETVGSSDYESEGSSDFETASDDEDDL